jgi:hypothetical protein
VAKSFKAGEAWIVELHENEWYLDKPDARYRRIQEVKQAARVEGCSSFSVFVTPDPIFPITEKTTRHRVHGENFPLNAKVKFEIRCDYRADIPLDIWGDTPEHLRSKLVTEARDALNACGVHQPGHYVILVGSTCLERGRV